jgi:hypothetical protein
MLTRSEYMEVFLLSLAIAGALFGSAMVLHAIRGLLFTE